MARSLGEQLLFPTGSERSSDEGSDWIVSDSEEEVDVTAFIDVELMKGVHSAVLMRDAVPLRVGNSECVDGDGVKCEESEKSDPGDSGNCDGSEDDLQMQLLKAVMCEDCVGELTSLLPRAHSLINASLLEGE